jgi:type IV pilus assembly protein PilB
MANTSLSVLEILQQQDYISTEDAQAAAAFKESGAGTAVEYLMREGIVNRPTVGLALAEYYGTTFTDLDARGPSDLDLARIPEDIARAQRVVFVEEKDDEVRVASDTVQGEGLSAAMQKLFPGKTIRVTYAFPEQIDELLSHHQKELNTRFAEIVTHTRKVAPELFDEIIKDSLTYRASDVHFEPGEKVTRIRFRIDGMLRQAGSIPQEYYESVLNRMKIMANLRTDEHFAPQDGAIRFTSGSTNVDLRLSIVPTLSGEKAVIRVLTQYVKGLSFASMGFSEAQAQILERATHKPFGMILTVGPTGSGKTTMLYTLIKKIMTPELNVMTIEDPVEYRVPGINQIQVNTKTGLTFAKGLRAIVRQDPNVILLGEIRDTETAETAVNAALTGHLLFSTFHANDAATAIPRLIDMQVEPFLLASTLELILAQRLARRICETCRESYILKAKDAKTAYPGLVGVLPAGDITLYRGNGCTACNGTGYRGRLPVVEMIEMTTALKALVETKPSADQVALKAREEGSRSLFEDGFDKALQGLTTLEEVLRVAKPGART